MIADASRNVPCLVLLFILVGEMNENWEHYPKKHEFVPDLEFSKLQELGYGSTDGYLMNEPPAPPPTRKEAEGFGMWDHDVFWLVSPAMHRVRSE